VETGDAVAPTSGAEPTAEELPVPEDFEEEVEAEIDAQNYLQALDTLDRELEGDEQAVDAD